GSSRMEMQGQELLVGDIYYKIESKRRSDVQELFPARSIRPGETREETRNLNLLWNGHNSGDDVKDATITLDMVAFSDRSVQFTNGDAFERAIASRKVNAKVARLAADIGRSILSNVSNQDVLREFHDSLMKAPGSEVNPSDPQAKNIAAGLMAIAGQIDRRGL